MQFLDFLFFSRWWLLFFLIGLTFLPLTFYFFDKFIDRGYIFSKIIGTVFVSYVVFLLGTLKILPFERINIFFIITIFLIINFFIFRRFKLLSRLNFKKTWKIFLLEEIIFTTALFFWSYVRAHQPDIHGLEKYMDFGFINSILRAEYFPAKDMWFTPLNINYYYFGHLITAVLTKISDIPSSIAFNLMLATMFAFTFTCIFSLGINLISQIKFRDLSKGKFQILVGGFLAAFLITFAGNLHAIYTLFKPYVNENPVPFWQLIFSPQTFPNMYWYPNATRFIYNTIHEFPIYSFVVSDLHGHVLDIPIVLTTLALLFSIFLAFNPKEKWLKKSTFSSLALLAFLLAVMYTTNAWDGLIYLLLSSSLLLYLYRRRLMSFFLSIILLVIGFVVFTIPFDIYFKPFVSGIGVLCAPDFLTNLGKIGPLLFEQNHCQKSPIWQLLILYGFFYFWVFSFILFLKKKKNIISSDSFIIILIAVSTLLIIIPEFIYAKDIYPAHYRANTMFKLVYQSFIMLSISSSYIIYRLISHWKLEIGNWKFPILIGLGSIGLFLVMIYPYFAINSYYGELKNYHSLDGITYLKENYPDDYKAINWLNKNIKGQPVILEAQGDSYTDFARVSANTGLPTVLGWTVHEWLWRGSYDIPAPRIADIKNLYETSSPDVSSELIEKYNISLVFVGVLERQKYPLMNEEKFNRLGRVIFQRGQTKIYQITPSQLLE